MLKQKEYLWSIFRVSFESLHYFFEHNASGYLHERRSMIYFIVTIYTDDNKDKTEYETYIKEVKPIVEHFGGRYLVRTNHIIPLSDKWKPERVIIIQWQSKAQMEQCFASAEYRKLAGKRENSVDSRAIIVEDEG